MAALTQGVLEETRRTALSPRPKGRGKRFCNVRYSSKRQSAKNVLCKNVTIHGYCKWENKGCAFNHDPVKPNTTQNQTDSVKKRLNVDSPSFTPASLAVNDAQLPTKTAGLSPKTASAAPFKPKGLTSVSPAPTPSISMKQYNPKAPDWVAPEEQEFLPQVFNAIPTSKVPEDPFAPSGIEPTLDSNSRSFNTSWRAQRWVKRDGSSRDQVNVYRSAEKEANNEAVALARFRTTPDLQTSGPGIPSKSPEPLFTAEELCALLEGLAPSSTVQRLNDSREFSDKALNDGTLEQRSIDEETPKVLQNMIGKPESRTEARWRRSRAIQSETSLPSTPQGTRSSEVSRGSLASANISGASFSASSLRVPSSASKHLKALSAGAEMFFPGSNPAPPLYISSASEPRFSSSRHIQLDSNASPNMVLNAYSSPVYHRTRNRRPRHQTPIEETRGVSLANHPMPFHQRYPQWIGQFIPPQPSQVPQAVDHEPPITFQQTPAFHPSMFGFTSSNSLPVNAFPSHSYSSDQCFHEAQGSFQVDNDVGISHPNIFDSYATAAPTSTHTTPQPQLNPYAQDGSNLGGAAYYQGSNNYSQQQLQHHLYAALGPHRELPANQRTVKDLFIPENLRQRLQMQTEATLTTMQNSTLPPNIGHFHTLVPLVDNHDKKDQALFGYHTWIFKAISNYDNNSYCLRRIQGYRPTINKEIEIAITSVQRNWKRVRNGNVVSVHLAFTSSGFGDSSLIFATDFHPSSVTLAQKHFPPVSRYSNRNTSAQIPEQVLWSYVVQIANALKAIHSVGLAARLIDSSKVLLTGENRVRLNSCAILDVLQYDTPHSLAVLQLLDLGQLGQLILDLGTNNPAINTNNSKMALLQFSRSYTTHLQESVNWLLEHNDTGRVDGIDVFLSMIASDVITVFDSSLHFDDELNTQLNREVENSRIARLLIKLNFINGRPEHEHDPRWSEQGNRFHLSLFRDYVFHQVDANGNPVMDLGHVLMCLNKLDVGSDQEKIELRTRDDNTVLVVSYRELKACVEGAYQELVRRGS